MSAPVPSTLTKTYPPRGPLRQFRFEQATAFSCFRCGDAKKAKLLAIYGGDWSRRLCNGCYGYLLSVYDIKAGTAPEDERADCLASALLSAITVDDQRRAEQLFRASEQRSQSICNESVRFIATAEHVAGQLEAVPQLEWSPAVIGLCKAVEAEIITRLLRPLSAVAGRENLTADRNDKDLGRAAQFCSDATRKPPELGTFAHFLQTLIHSSQRREASPLLRSFLNVAASWPGSQWILDPNGLHKSLTTLTANFRNRAAHIDELGREDYLSCRDHVIGPQGLLWRLSVSTGSV